MARSRDLPRPLAPTVRLRRRSSMASGWGVSSREGPGPAQRRGPPMGLRGGWFVGGNTLTPQVTGVRSRRGGGRSGGRRRWHYSMAPARAEEASRDPWGRRRRRQRGRRRAAHPRRRRGGAAGRRRKGPACARRPAARRGPARCLLQFPIQNWPARDPFLRQPPANAGQKVRPIRRIYKRGKHETVSTVGNREVLSCCT